MSSQSFSGKRCRIWPWPSPLPEDRSRGQDTTRAPHPHATGASRVQAETSHPPALTWHQTSPRSQTYSFPKDDRVRRRCRALEPRATGGMERSPAVGQGGSPAQKVENKLMATRGRTDGHTGSLGLTHSHHYAERESWWDLLQGTTQRSAMTFPGTEPIGLSQCYSLSRVRLFATPWTVARQAPLSMGFSRQQHWSDCLSLLQGIFPTQGWNWGLLHCRRIPYHLSHSGYTNS